MPRVVYSTGFLTEANKTNISPTVITLVEISPSFAPNTVDAFATFPLPAPQNYNNLLRTVSSIEYDIASGIGQVSIAITNADLSRVADESKGYYQGYECKVHKVLRLDNGSVIGILLLYGVVTSYSIDEKTLNLEVVTRINAANSITNRDCEQKCPWVFKGTECGYTGVLTTCNKVYNSADGCSGRSNQHRFGGFPGRDSIAALGVVSGQGTTPNFQFSLPSSTIIVTSSTSIPAPDISYVECRHTAPITITLPDPSATSLKKQTITIKDASVSGAAANNITIQAAVGTTINGASSFTLNADKQAVSLTPSDDALDWRIVSGYATGNVSSVALTAPSILNVSGSPITSSGTIALTLATQNANTIFAGPTTGSAAAPTFRALGLTDLPQIASNRLLGRVTASTGPVEQITPGTGILTWLQTPTGTNLYSAISSGKTGLGGDLVFSWGPVFLGLTTDFISGVAIIDGGQTTGTQGRQIKFVGVTSSLHNIQISNSSATSGPKIDVDSGSTNVGLIVSSKGTGELQLFGGNVSVYNNTSTSGGQLRLQYSSSSASSGVIRFYGSPTNFISLRSPSTLTADTAYILPASDGTSSQVLTTDGTGNLSWTTVTGVGTVTSVTVDIGTTGIGLLTSSGSPITSSGTISLGLTNQSQNTVLAGPITGTATTPSFRALVVGDIPDLSSIYQPLDADLTAIAALTANGLLRKTAGVWAMDSASYLTANQTITLSGDITGSGSTSITTTIANDAVTYAKIQNVSAASRLLGRGSAGGSGDVEEIVLGSGLSMSGTTLSATAVGGVTSVGLSAPSIFTVTNSPITSTGTLTLTLATQAANTIFAGPAIGSAADPTFRLMVISDLPNQTGDRTGTGALVFATSPTITTPRISTIHTASSPNNAVLSFAQNANSVNYLQIGNAATGFQPTIEPVGSDATIGITISSKSLDDIIILSRGLVIEPINTSFPGEIIINGGASPGTGGALILRNPGGSGSIGFVAPDTIPSPVFFTLPSGDGTNGQVLKTNGSGVLSWATVLTSNQTITLSGDVTGSGATSIATTIANNAVTTAKILNANVTYAKIQNISAASRLLGRGSNSGSGSTEEITIGYGLTMQSTSLQVNSSDIIQIIQNSGIIPGPFTGVTSVGLSAPSIFTVSNSPITTSGTIGLALVAQNPNRVFAGPASGSTPLEPTFRSLVVADIPDLSSIYQPLDADLTAIAALTTNGLLRKTAGVWAMDSASYLTANQTITLSGDITGSGSTSIAATIGSNKVTLGMLAQIATNTFLGRVTSGTGNVEALTNAQATSILSVFVGDTGSGGVKGLVPAPTIGDANNFLRGDGAWVPVSGGGGGTVTSVALTVPSFLSVTGSPITASGTLSVALATQTANTIFAGPATGSADQPTFRLMVTADIPNDIVTYAKMQDVSAASRLLGRGSAGGSGDVEEITVGGGIEFTSGTGIQTTALTGDVTKTAGGTSTTIANDAVTPAKLSADAQAIVFRNRIINGSMMIAQRGTSFTSASTVSVPVTTPPTVPPGGNNDNSYTLDRWVILSDGTASGNPLTNDTVDVTQSTDAPTGSLFSIALDVESINRKFGILQIIEQRNCVGLIGNTVTLSFKAKVSNATRLNNVKCAILAWSGTADTFTGATRDVVSAWNPEGTDPTLVTNWTYENTPTDLNVTTSWATYSVSAAVDTANAKNVAVFIWSDVSTVTGTNLGDILYITDVQLERGSTATAFEFRPYQVEFELARRYYWRIKGGSQITNLGPGVASSATNVNILINFGFAMRASPTERSNYASATLDDFTQQGPAVSDIFILFTNENGCNIVAQKANDGVNPFTAREFYLIFWRNASNYIEFDAEL